jgi:cytochrome c oxidase cbb3-type subunit III
MQWGLILLPCVLCLSLPGCDREARPFRERPVASSPVSRISPYQENAWGISEGKRLYENFNCVGCHAHGGGGMGPPLMDDKWIYGSHPATVFETIVEGRPNGMPSFRNKITDSQVWQIVAYVESMSGQAPLPTLPGRSDHLAAGTPESGRRAQTPVTTGTP